MNLTQSKMENLNSVKEECNQPEDLKVAKYDNLIKSIENLSLINDNLSKLISQLTSQLTSSELVDRNDVKEIKINNLKQLNSSNPEIDSLKNIQNQIDELIYDIQSQNNIKKYNQTDDDDYQHIFIFNQKIIAEATNIFDYPCTGDYVYINYKSYKVIKTVIDFENVNTKIYLELA